MSKFTVLFDACVLYPAPLRDLLLQLATAKLFRAKWSEAIHEEWIAAVLRKRSDLDRATLERTRNLMNGAVPDCLVEGYEHLVPTITLPDPDDRHVVAAAVHGRCDAVVTFNRKDFPADELVRHGLEVIHPDDFISYQFDLDEAAALIAAQKCRARLRNPPKTAEDYLDTLRAQALPKTVAALDPFRTVL